MPTLVTLKNIGRKTEKFNGTTIPVGGTYVVDLDDEVVRKELRNDHDYVVLPDSAAGTGGGGGGGIVAYADSTILGSLQIGDGSVGGNVGTDLGISLEFTGDGDTDHLLEFHAPRLVNTAGSMSPFEGGSIILIADFGSGPQTVVSSNFTHYDGAIPSRVGTVSERSITVKQRVPAWTGLATFTALFVGATPEHMAQFVGSGELDLPLDIPIAHLSLATLPA